MEGIPKMYTPEKREQKELFRASLGFDFIFFLNEKGEKKALCIEINGQRTGVRGYAEVTSVDKNSQFLAKSRMTVSHKKKEAIQLAKEKVQRAERAYISEEGVKQLAEEEKNQILSDVRLFEYAFENPAFIEDVANNKAKQEAFIPEEYRPRYWQGDGDISKTGFWIIKPNTSFGGRGITIVSQDELPKALANIREELGIIGGETLFTIQEFYEALGAERAPEEVAKNPASLRLLIDFQYLEDGTVRKIQQVAYQRVSPQETDRQNLEETAIVNFSRGAKAVEASREEIQQATAAAEGIIQNIGKIFLLEHNRTDSP